METNYYYPIVEWEEAASGRADIAFEEFQLKDHVVTGVNGYVLANGKRRRVQWLFDGKCYYKGRRIYGYDITF